MITGGDGRPDATLRHNVIYIPSVHAIVSSPYDSAARFTFTHNIVFDTLPAKVKNPLIRLLDVENLVSAHNVWCVRTGPQGSSSTFGIDPPNEIGAAFPPRLQVVRSRRRSGADRALIHLEAGAHGRGEADLLDVGAFGT